MTSKVCAKEIHNCSDHIVYGRNMNCVAFKSGPQTTSVKLGYHQSSKIRTLFATSIFAVSSPQHLSRIEKSRIASCFRSMDPDIDADSDEAQVASQDMATELVLLRPRLKGVKDKRDGLTVL